MSKATSTTEQSAASALVEALSATPEPVVRVKRKYTVTPDRPKNKPNTSPLALRQISNANRITGTTTAVYDLVNVDPDEVDDFVALPTDGSEERWLTVCHDHEFSTTHHTLLIARRIAFLPNLWCPECAEEAPVVEDLDADDAADAVVRGDYAPQH